MTTYYACLYPCKCISHGDSKSDDRFEPFWKCWSFWVVFILISFLRMNFGTSHLHPTCTFFILSKLQTLKIYVKIHNYIRHVCTYWNVFQIMSSYMIINMNNVNIKKNILWDFKWISHRCVHRAIYHTYIVPAVFSR